MLGLTLVGTQPDTTFNLNITRVIDGDTIEISAPFLPEILGPTLSLRIRGIDTPERGFRAACRKENRLAARAKNFVKNQLKNAVVVKIILLKWDKYGGRVIGDIYYDGKMLSQQLLENNLAVQYDGGKKNKDWCR